MSDEADKSFSPYKGLIPYDENDARFFFGRQRETRLIIANLFASPLTLLFGVSGVGKSSVLRAGVAHELRGHAEVLTLVYDRWEKDPREGIKAALQKAAYEKAATAKKELAQMPSPGDNLAVYLEKLTAALGCRLMILLDQFEDYLQYHPTNHPFADEFASAVMRSNIPVSFLISIREDTFARLDRFEGSIPILFNNYLRLEHLNRKSAEEAIRLPIARYNETFKPKTPYQIDPALVEVVLTNVHAGSMPFGQARGNILKADERKNHFDTVFLQLIMTRLWEEETGQGSHKLRRTTLDKLHGVGRIVRDHIDEVMNRLTGAEKRYASRAFRYLVTPSGTKVAYSATDLRKQDTDLKTVPIEQLEQMLQKLSRGPSRILRQVTPTTESHEQQYEIYHDALGPAVLDWGLRYLRKQSEADYDKKLKVEKAEAERRWRRRFFTAVVITIGMGLITGILAFLAITAWKNKRAAEEAQGALQIQTEKALEQQATAQMALDLVKQQDHRIKYTKAVLRGHSARVVSAAFSPVAPLVVTAGGDKNLIIWNLNTGDKVAVLSGHTAPLTDLTYSPDGRYLVTASEDRTALLWDSADWTKKPLEMKEHNDTVTKAAFSPNNKHIATASVDTSVCLWEVGQNYCTFRLRGHVGPVTAVEFSPNGEHVLTASSDGTAKVWDTNTGQPLLVLRGHRGVINSAKFSRSGKTIVTASSDKTAIIWDANTGNPLVTLRGHEESVNSAEFSPDGELVVTASSDHTARIWRAGKGEVLNVLRGHTDKVNAATFSHDGQRVVTASDDKTARVWNTHAQKQILLAELEGHLGRVTTALFSPDNDSLVVTTGSDQTARIYDTTQLSSFLVSEAKVDAVDYQGPCPSVVRLVGRIDIAAGSGTIVYRFVRSDGMSWPRRQVEVDSSQPKWVIEYLRVGKFNTPRSTSYYLEISEPNNIESPPMKLRLRCGATPAATATPPPVGDNNSNNNLGREN